MEVEADDCVTMVQLATQKCLEKEALCNEFYLQLIKQTTDQPGEVLLYTHIQFRFILRMYDRHIMLDSH